MTYTDELLARWAAPLPPVRDLEDERRHDLAVEVLRLRSAVVEAAASERRACAELLDRLADTSFDGIAAAYRNAAARVRARGLAT